MANKALHSSSLFIPDARFQALLGCGALNLLLPVLVAGFDGTPWEVGLEVVMLYEFSTIALIFTAIAVQRFSQTFPTPTVSGNTVLITGGSSGIGLALAKKFLQARNRVIVTGREPEKLAQVQAVFPQIVTEVADLENRAALQKLVTRYPEVNILINNAGVQYNYEFVDAEIPIETIETELRINLIAPLQLTKLMLPQLTQKPKAAIVNISSGLGLIPKQIAPVYCGSKAGLHIATKALNWQLETTSVKVFEVIAPLVDTPMTAGRDKGKISPDALVSEFWNHFCCDWFNLVPHRVEIPIGKVKLLLVLQRWLPWLAEKIIRPGL
jgi:short-subunit dehydrogenase involved in D-alanine esterification of teichoic acids